jgi:hypothetical protein
MPTRRAFTLGLLGAGGGLALSPQAGATGAGASTAPTAGASATSPGAPASTAAGELGARIALTMDRFTGGGVPAFTREFVIADVALEPPRRFNEYSGDLSGRYVEALSLLPPAGGVGLDTLVRDILGHQRPDGRFGDPDLRYSAEEIGGLHMAQLWGNGRLLLGLVQHHAVSGDAEVLAGARRLADFLVGVRAQTSDPAVVSRVLDQGAMGIICFTQLVEPLVLLAELTGETRYLDEARKIGATLGPRGTQHAHGYLTTARGMVALAEATSDPALLSRVETLYADLVTSPDLLCLGGVPEYFGWGRGSSEPARDEGCAVADFLRLSLMLHRATGRTSYLDRAERCLLNHFSFNQFSTGDFGHHAFFSGGAMPTESVGRAWWCCTMHGHRAFRHVLDSVVRLEDETVHVDLCQDVDWSGEGARIAIRHRVESPAWSRLVIEVGKASEGLALALRRPAWAASVAVTVDGADAAVDDKGGELNLRPRLTAGNRVEVAIEHRAWIETRDGREVALDDLRGEVEGVLFVGPWLYVVDDGTEPLFFGEPWKGANVVMLPAELRSPEMSLAAGALTHPKRHIAARYLHGGFPGEEPVRLRPIAEQTDREPGTVATWLRYRKESA